MSISNYKSEIYLRNDSYNDVKIRKMWSELAKDRNYICPICKKQNIEGNFVVDHNHHSNIIRDVICRSCNYTLHYIEDLKAVSPDYKPFYDYLKKAEEEEIELQTFYNDVMEMA